MTGWEVFAGMAMVIPASGGISMSSGVAGLIPVGEDDGVGASVTHRHTRKKPGMAPGFLVSSSVAGLIPAGEDDGLGRG